MPTPFQRSELTQRLIDYLRQHNKGDVIGYDELTRHCEAQITSESGNLKVARDILERDHAQVWVSVPPRVGVCRLTDPQIAERQRSWFLSGARNRLDAGAREADVVQIEQLDIGQQARFATDSIVREIARDALGRAMHRRIDKVARGTSNDLPTFSAVDWMISLSPRRSGSAK